jgi:histidine racemase
MLILTRHKTRVTDREIIYRTIMQKPFIQRLAVLYPGGNTTTLVLDQDPSIQSQNRTILNQKIIDSYPEFAIEQCGFVLQPTDASHGALARLEMFGGEFCANAARSTIALLTGKTVSQGLLEVSGTSQLLHWYNDGTSIRVQMPLPLYSELTERTEDGVLVRLDGITHLVVLDKGVAPIGDAFTQYADKLMQKYDLKSLVAAGISWYDSSTNQATFRVYVQAVNTLFDETACGSGTCAIGMALAAAQNTAALSMEIIQPSGESISFTLADGHAYISGPVSVLYDGELSL